MCKQQSEPVFIDNSTACEMCDWVNPVPPIPVGYRLRCQRCHHLLYTHRKQIAAQLWLNSAAALIMLLLSLQFNFLGFSSEGVTRNISFMECILNLTNAHHPFLAVIVTLLLLVFPGLYLAFVILLLFMIHSHLPLPHHLYRLVHLLETMKPWLMADVFLLGGLVSLIKLHSLASVELGYSFWAFCCFTILVARVVMLVEKRWFWRQLVGKSSIQAGPSGTAREQGLIGCKFCGALVAGHQHSCPRCHHIVSSRKEGSLSTTCALLLAACILYLPANLYPIMTTTFLGQAEASTIIGGIIVLWAMHSYPVALVILIASIIVPLAKILALLWLCWHTRFPAGFTSKQKLTVYHITEYVGKWSMVDVFVVAILAALVQLGALMNIIPGQAALAFSFVVIFTMLAAMSFDPRLLWDR